MLNPTRKYINLRSVSIVVHCYIYLYCQILLENNYLTSLFSSSVIGAVSGVGCSISVVVITPSGTGVIVSPLAIVLSLGLPKPSLFLRFFS